MNEVGGEEQSNDGGGSVAAAVAAAAPPTRYFWNRRIRHSEQASTLGVCMYVRVRVYAGFHRCGGWGKRNDRIGQNTRRHDLNTYPAEKRRMVTR